MWRQLSNNKENPGVAFSIRNYFFIQIIYSHVKKYPKVCL